MVNNLVRLAIEKLYEGQCTITVKETKRVNGITRTEDKVYCENQPCKLSYQSTSSSNETETVSTSYQEIKLFIAPEIEIPEGAKISVTQDGRTELYKRSSKPMVYSNHQEVLLDRLENN
jgi:hypothetical protein